MSSWVLVPSAVQLRDEFNDLRPNRDKASDGSVGDTAHQGNSSNHNPDESGNTPHEDSDSKNEVHAIDVDKDLDPHDSGLMQRIIDEVLLPRVRSGEEDRLIEIIYNRHCWYKSSGWNKKDYTGSNPHDKHAHFGFSYDSGHEADTSSWHLSDVEDTLTGEDMDKLAGKIADAIARMGVKVENETWRFDTAEGYRTRKSYELDRTLDAMAGQLAAVVAALNEIVAALPPIEPAR
jgi:hypothetical protein